MVKYQMQGQRYYGNKTIAMLAGMLVGGMVGAATMLVLVPQSGKKTRHQIQKKSIELRDKAAETVEDFVAQMRQTAEKMSGDVRKKVNEIQQHSQDIFENQQEKLTVMITGKNKDEKVRA